MSPKPESTGLTPAQKRAKQSAYNRAYYEKNRGAISRRKKKRYENDEEYRSNVLDSAAKQRRKDKQVRRIKGTGGGGRKPRGLKEVRVPRNNGDLVIVTMYTIGQAADFMGVSPHTLRKWERENALPQVMYTTPGGHRQYTEDQLEALLAVYEKFQEEVQPWRIIDDFVRGMHEAWDALDNGVSPLSGEDHG